jgi:hypothetical protein
MNRSLRTISAKLILRHKTYPAFEKPTLVGSVLRGLIVKKIQKSLMSTDETAAKKFLNDESSLAVFSTAEKLGVLLDKHKINYAIVGGFALNIHGFKRQTTDVDLLMSKDDLQLFQEKIVFNGFAPRFRGAKKSFRDPVSNVGVDILTSGDFPGDGKQSEIAFPVPDENNTVAVDNLKVINLSTLINLKLAAYSSLKQVRMKDRTDVAGLVKNLTLDDSYSSHLHECVRKEYLTIVEEVAAEEKIDHGF